MSLLGAPIAFVAFTRLIDGRQRRALRVGAAWKVKTSAIIIVGDIATWMGATPLPPTNESWPKLVAYALDATDQVYSAAMSVTEQTSEAEFEAVLDQIKAFEGSRPYVLPAGTFIALLNHELPLLAEHDETGECKMIIRELDDLSKRSATTTASVARLRGQRANTLSTSIVRDIGTFYRNWNEIVRWLNRAVVLASEIEE